MNFIIGVFLDKSGGLRRYQNEDGSLTEEGKKRYNSENSSFYKETKKKLVKKDVAKSMSDQELRKQNERLQLENNYYRLKKEYDRNQSEIGKTKTNQILQLIKNQVLKPAAIGASKDIVQDLLTQLGKTMNTSINKSFSNTINPSKPKNIDEQRLKELQTKLNIKNIEKQLENIDKKEKNESITKQKKILEEIKKYSKNW